FAGALRIDPLLLYWPETAPKLGAWGYKVDSISPTQKFFDEVRRFLADWTKRIGARYVMASIPPDFEFPARNILCELLQKAILPHCRDHGIPFALMLGCKRAANPSLKLAGDASGFSNLSAVQNLCAGFPDNKFLVTVLARENQHELCVLARKFRNLHLFGCWWFMNIPYLVDEITRLRIELIGLSCTPQHSDARVLDQIVYKWQHSRRV